jgi:hypothetical protein
VRELKAACLKIHRALALPEVAALKRVTALPLF